MPTGARGEALLEIGDDSYPILFTNRALAEAEQRTGRSITMLLRDASTGHIGIGEAAALLLTGLEAGRRDAKTGGKAFTMANAYDMMDAVGFGNVAKIVLEGISAVVAFDPNDEEEGADDDDRPPQ